MARHQDATIQFDVPRDWQDRTIVAYSAPPRPVPQSTPNLVLTRQELPDDDTLESYVDRHIDQLAERMDAFEIIAEDRREIGGCRAICFRLYTQSSQGSFRQRLTMVELPGRVVAAMTLTAPEDEAEQLDPLFDRIESTIRPGGAAGGAAS